MHKWAAAAAAGLAMVGGAAAAHPADGFCADLGRVLEAALDDSPFESLERSRAAPPRFGFPRGCRRGGTSRRLWICHQSLAPPRLSAERLAADTARCLGAAPVRTGPSGAEFALPHARILIRETGAPRAHVGRIVTYTVEALAAAPEAEKK